MGTEPEKAENGRIDYGDYLRAGSGRPKKVKVQYRVNIASDRFHIHLGIHGKHKLLLLANWCYNKSPSLYIHNIINREFNEMLHKAAKMSEAEIYDRVMMTGKGGSVYKEGAEDEMLAIFTEDPEMLVRRFVYSILKEHRRRGTSLSRSASRVRMIKPYRDSYRKEFGMGADKPYEHRKKKQEKATKEMKKQLEVFRAVQEAAEEYRTNGYGLHGSGI